MCTLITRIDKQTKTYEHAVKRQFAAEATKKGGQKERNMCWAKMHLCGQNNV